MSKRLIPPLIIRDMNGRIVPVFKPPPRYQVNQHAKVKPFVSGSRYDMARWLRAYSMWRYPYYKGMYADDGRLYARIDGRPLFYTKA